MSEMIERVARAIFGELWGAGDWESIDAGGPEVPKSMRGLTDGCRDAARAAIEAMREPTEGQYEALSATGLMWREMNSKLVWQTYIDAALDAHDS